MSIEIAEELELQAAYYASRATEEYPETVFPPPRLGATSTPDAYAAAGYRNAYRLVAGELRARAAELRVAAAKDGGAGVVVVERVLCPKHGERVMDLDGPEPMCEDCRVVGPDGQPLGWQDGVLT